MPTVLKIFGFTFIIYTKDHLPPHVHVKIDGREVVIELSTGRVIKNKGFKDHQINKVVELVRKYEEEISKKWNEIHGKKKDD